MLHEAPGSGTDDLHQSPLHLAAALLDAAARGAKVKKKPYDRVHATPNSARHAILYMCGEAAPPALPLLQSPPAAGRLPCARSRPL